MEIIKEMQEVEIENAIMTWEEYNKKLKDDRLLGRNNLANELRNMIVNFDNRLNIGGMTILFKSLLDEIMKNILW